MDSFDFKYTDIDYQVFTDAARFVYQGESPYKRATYRYTPLLSVLLVPTVYFKPFGKILFIACDLLTGWLIGNFISKSNSKKWIYTAFWQLNPFMAVICTRGSSESLLSALVLATLYCIKEKKLALGSVLFGLSVHLKLYPIIYALAIWFSIDKSTSFFTKNRIAFGISSASVFIAVNLVVYYWFGDEFIQHTFLYHITRRDHRHNFSLYFYQMYHSFYSKQSLKLLRLVAFVPQLASVLMISYKFPQLLDACFLGTFSFVAFNKVITSQYFYWYLCFLPIVLANHSIPTKKSIQMLLVWISSQGLWLFTAFLLEIRGRSVFRLVELASIVFFISNIWILTQFCALLTTPVARTSSIKKE